MVEIPQDFQDLLRRYLPYADPGRLRPSDELVRLGLDSIGVVRLLTDIEDGYQIEFPDDIVNEETFATAGSLWHALSTLTATSGRL
jgi:acyl carrier protein